VGKATVLSHCSLLRNLWLKPACVLEHCREGEPNYWFSIFGGSFLLTASLRRRKNLMYISSFTAVIPINYTSEFREIFKAPMCN
jgi:hypothetical protein